MELSRK